MTNEVTKEDMIKHLERSPAQLAFDNEKLTEDQVAKDLALIRRRAKKLLSPKQKDAKIIAKAAKTLHDCLQTIIAVRGMEAPKVDNKEHSGEVTLRVVYDDELSENGKE